MTKGKHRKPARGHGVFPPYVNLPKLENLLHRFFDPAAAKIQVTDAQGNYHTPKEWFSIPIATIETALRLLISGEIVNYSYNPGTGQILLNE
jgi:hypothetical protein